MKKLLFKCGIVVLTSLMLAASPVGAQSNEPVTITIDGKLQQYDQPPIIKDGRTLVPLRGIFESLGAKVHWNQETQTITAIKEGNVIELTIGQNVAYINNVKMDLDVSAQLVNDRTLVPIRFIAESLDKKVDWNSKNKRVSIIDRIDSKVSGPKEEPSPLKDISNIFKHNIGIGVTGTIPIENSILNLDKIETVGNGGDNIIRLSGNGILYIDRDHANNPGYNDGFDIYLGRIQVVSNLEENGVPIEVTITNKQITKIDGSPFGSKTKGTIWVGIILRGETDVFTKTTIEVDIP